MMKRLISFVFLFFPITMLTDQKRDVLPPKTNMEYAYSVTKQEKNCSYRTRRYFFENINCLSLVQRLTLVRTG